MGWVVIHLVLDNATPSWAGHAHNKSSADKGMSVRPLEFGVSQFAERPAKRVRLDPGFTGGGSWTSGSTPPNPSENWQPPSELSTGRPSPAAGGRLCARALSASPASPAFFSGTLCHWCPSQTPAPPLEPQVVVGPSPVTHVQESYPP